MLTEILSNVTNENSFSDAIECLSQEFYTYGYETDNLYNDIDLDGYDWRNGISKVVILFPQYVLKTCIVGWVEYDSECDSDIFHENEENVDYCEIEYKVYQEAKRRHLEEFFAETVKVSDHVYAQEAYDDSFDDWTNDELENTKFSEEIYSKFHCLHNRVRTALRVFLGQHSFDKVLELQDFLEEFDINDLHSGNLGWFNGVLKLVDYSGYGSETSNLL